MADALRELVDILPGLKAALEYEATKRPAPPVEPPLAYRKQQSANMCGISARLLERLLAAGKFPRPDAYAGRCPLWTRATLSDWIGKGGGRI